MPTEEIVFPSGDRLRFDPTMKIRVKQVRSLIKGTTVYLARLSLLGHHSWEIEAKITHHFGRDRYKIVTEDGARYSVRQSEIHLTRDAARCALMVALNERAALHSYYTKVDSDQLLVLASLIVIVRKHS